MENISLIRIIPIFASLFLSLSILIHTRKKEPTSTELYLISTGFFVMFIALFFEFGEQIDHYKDNILLKKTTNIHALFENILLMVSFSLLYIGLKIRAPILNKLIETQEQLKRMQCSLEDKVAERTRSIEEVNSDLIEKIAELKTTKIHLETAKKKEVIGSLAAGVAHDFNNTLNSYAAYIHKLKQKYGEDENIIKIDKLTHQTANIVKQIQLLSKNEVIKKEPIHLSSILSDIPLYRKSSFLDSNVCIETKIDSKCKPILAVPIQIHQVFMNIFSNAIFAVKNSDKPTIKISIKNKIRLEDKPPNLYHKNCPDCVCLCIEDNGPGFKENEIENIFEPYYTTKSKEGGTGLGLALAKGIIESHGGIIFAKNIPSGGASFTICLPTTEQKLVDKKNLKRRKTDIIPKTITDSKEKKEILWVDDDLDPRLWENILNEDGRFIPTIFTNSKEAWQFFQDNPDKFHLVISDLIMPGIDGMELIKRIREIDINIPIIALTGQDSSRYNDKSLSLNITLFLTKPIMPPEILNILNNILFKKEKRVE